MAIDQPCSYEQVSAAVDKYSDMVRRICFLYLKNYSDVEDVFQEVFLKFMLHIDEFDNEQHEKAWLCRVAYIQCKDLLKSSWRKKVVSINDIEIQYETEQQSEMISVIMKLPPNYRQVLYLHYYEQMTIPEISEILKQNENTVYTHLRRAKSKLRNILKEECCYG